VVLSCAERLLEVADLIIDGPSDKRINWQMKVTVDEKIARLVSFPVSAGKYVIKRITVGIYGFTHSVDEPALGVVLEILNLFCQLAALKKIITIQDRDKFAIGPFQREIDGSGLATILALRMGQQLNCAPGSIALQYLVRSVSRAVVYDDNFDRRVILFENGFKRCLNELPPVKNGN